MAVSDENLLTWNSSLSSLQTWTSGTDFVGSSLPQWADGELEGTAGHVHAVVFDADRVHARLVRHKADAVGVVLALHDLSLVDLT